MQVAMGSLVLAWRGGTLWVESPGWSLPMTAEVVTAAGTVPLLYGRAARRRYELAGQSGPGLRLDSAGICLDAWLPENDPAVRLRLGWVDPAAARPVAGFRFNVGLAASAALAGWTALHNGWISWSHSRPVSLETWEQVRFQGADRQVSRPDPGSPLVSEWFTVVRPGPSGRRSGGGDSQAGPADGVPGRPDLLAGFVTGADQFGQIAFRTGPAGLELAATSWADGTAAPASEWLELRFGPAAASLAGFGAAVAAAAGARPGPAPPAGWCTWYDYFWYISEEEVLRNLDALAAAGAQYPADLVQIDDGWQQNIGDWEPGPRFPRGMAWLAGEIRRRGRRPGIWLAPFIAKEDSRTAQERPDWLLRDAAGQPVVDREQWGGRVYCLDTTHPGVLAWLEEMGRRVRREWGYDYVKADFIYAAALDGVRHDPGATRAQAYRRGMAALRRGLGDDAFLLACGAPLSATPGLAEGCRIGPDVAPLWVMDWGGGVQTAGINTLVRSWMQGRLWHSDPDCLLVRTERTGLTRAEVETLATFIGLSGGMVLGSDGLLSGMPPERMALLPFLLPPGPPAAPPDLLTPPAPRLFALPGGGTVGAFNWSDDPQHVSIPLPPGEHHVFEHWQSRYLGRLTATAEIDLPPHACALLAVRPAGAGPQVVHSTLHVTQGLVEVSDWQYAEGTLRCRIAHSHFTAGELVLAGPDGMAWDGCRANGGHVFADDAGDGLIRLTLSGPGPGLDLTLFAHWRLD